MNIQLKDENAYIVRFDKGEEVITSLADFMHENNITACSFSAIGSTGEIELGYYNKNLKEYRRKPFYEELEIISCNGNGGIMDAKPVIHAHGMFGRTDFTTIGGHIFKMVVTATCEVVITKLHGELVRGKNEEFKLNLLK